MELYKSIGDPQNIFDAYKKAIKGKKTKRKVCNFELSAGSNLFEISRHVLQKRYNVSPSNMFQIFCAGSNKIRNISSPTIRDSIIQHALYNKVYEMFDRGAIHDSYGCRIDKGTHKAADRCQKFLRRYESNKYYLQMDISKYYYSINHKVLRESLERKIDCKYTIDLMMDFVNTDDGVGLNVGNLLSQLYGIIYLDRFDHYVKRVLKQKSYIRYVDDMIIIGMTKAEAKRVKKQCEKYLKKELKLKFSKWNISLISKGVNFVGFRTWQGKRLIRKRSMRTFNRRLRETRIASIQAVMAHSRNTSSYKYLLRRLVDTLPIELLRKFGGMIKDDILTYYYSDRGAFGDKDSPIVTRGSGKSRRNRGKAFCIQ